MSDVREPFIKNHADGSLDFERGEQIGEWTTYGRDGAPYKVTTIKTKVKK